MAQQLSSQPVPEQGFEGQWAAWEARAAANNRATRVKLFIVAAILLSSAAILSGLWLLR